MKRVWVVVLGDVGRSPRMQYHTSSLCKTGECTVNLIGYRGSNLIDELQTPLEEHRVILSYIPDLPKWVNKLPRPLAYPLKAFLQLAVMIYMFLWSLPKPDIILLQLPPAIPTMVVCAMAARRHKARLIYDWHNFAYTIMALSLGKKSFFVKIAEKYERWLGTKAHGGLCVTKAMQQELLLNWGTEASVFYDRPPAMFRPSTIEEQHGLLHRLAPTIETPMHKNDFAAEEMKIINNAAQKLRDDKKEKQGSIALATLCTRYNAEDASIILREDRPAVLVSSTSWTADEDFSILLAAAQRYDSLLKQKKMKKKGKSDSRLENWPRLVIFVTGRGPQREIYEARMHQLDLQFVAFRTVWLEPGDYPLLLGSADVGVSLHASSSGLDLPMKVVDMFGCALPVCALSYSCIDELVVDGENGLLFEDEKGLAECFVDIFDGFLEGGKMLSALKRGVENRKFDRWHENWMKVVYPLLF